MPRRNTKINPQRENAISDKSICEGGDDVAVKKEAFLRDFDIEVEKRIEEMKNNVKTVLREVGNKLSKQKLVVKKHIRSMKVLDFIAKGGDLSILDFKEISIVLSDDVSFLEASVDQDITFKAPEPTLKRTTRKRGTAIAQSPLVNDAPLTRSLRASRAASRKTAQTSAYTSKPSKKPLQTQLVTPKFDPMLPITAAREPKNGETLLSLAGSPVQPISNQSLGDDTVLSLCLNKQQTLLSGSLFNATMSPGTLLINKERLQEAIGAINSRLNDLDSQVSCLSK